MRTHRFMKVLLLAAVVVMIAGVLPAGMVAQAQDDGETTLERAQREGVVRVGFANEAPYAFAQLDGTLSGEAVEVARAVFAELGITEMEGVLTEFGSLIPGLQAGRFDVITAGMFINPGRCEQILFADPEYKIGEALIVEAGNPLGLASYEDIAANPDITVGTGAGYLEIDYLTSVGVSEDQIVTFPDGPAGVAGLQAGQIDVWTATGPAVQSVFDATGDDSLEIASPFTDPVIDGVPVTGYGGAGFRVEDADFRDAFNAELQELKDSGRLLEILEPFEGFGEQSLPGDVTSAELCGGAEPEAVAAADMDDMSDDETTLERAQREGVVRVGFANEAPYAFAQLDGTLSGEAVEVARAVFAELGITEMEGVLTEFGSLIPGLQAGRFDVITAGMFINPGRCEQILFADPEYKIGEALIVEAGNPLGLTSYEDIAANPDITVGTGAGYLEIDYLTSVGVSEDQIVTFPDGPAGVAGLQAGQIDVWTATGPAVQSVFDATGDDSLEIASPFTDPVIDGVPVTGYGGAGFRTEDADFRDAFNAELQDLKDSGELLTILEPFEGFGEQSLPGDVTAEELCNR